MKSGLVMVLVACVRPEATPVASNRDYKNDPFVDGEKFKELGKGISLT